LVGTGSVQWPQEAWWRRYGDIQFDALMAEALQDAPSLQVAQARVRQASALVEQQGAALKPNVQLNASVTSQRQSSNNGVPAAFVPQGWNDYGRATLELGYSLDLWGRQRAALAAATSSEQASRADAALARLALTTNLAQAWADFARLFAQLDTAQSALVARTQTAELMQRRETQGLETRASVRQAQARQAQAQGEVLALQESVVLQRHLIAALLGSGPDRGAALPRPRLALDVPQALPADLPVNLLGRRPDIVAARLRAEAAGQQIKVARAAFYPDVNLSALIGVQSLGLDLLAKGGSRMGSVGPALSLPLFDQGRLQGAYAQAHAGYEEAVAGYQQTLSQALQEVADAATSRQALGGRLAQAQAATDAAREAWQLSQRRYEGGLATYLDVLAAQDSYLALERDLTALQARHFQLDVTLVRALGGGYRAQS
jgi:NodT family efflux transporter outer membrane factor (OMF) lipoprotein